ncbi:hypothetical protein BH23PLA1_BH23PLA1_01040 [soil metagenome]
MASFTTTARQRRARIFATALGLIGAVSIALPTVEAQTAAPSLTGLFPPALTIGVTTETTLSGQGLNTLEGVSVSGQGVEVAEIEPGSNGQRRVRFRVSADAEPGFREVHALGSGGLSNLLLLRLDSIFKRSHRSPTTTPSRRTRSPSARPSPGRSGRRTWTTSAWKPSKARRSRSRSKRNGWARRSCPSLVTPIGNIREYEILAQGLPPGVNFERVRVVFPRTGGGNPPTPFPRPSGGALVLEVESDALAELGTLEIVATARPDDGPPIRRIARAPILLTRWP